MISDSPTVAGVVARTAPPLAVSATTFLGIAVQEWVLILTIIYTSFQIVRLLPKMYGCVRCFIKYRGCYQKCKE